MKGAIFFASKYGSTAQYSNWLAEATGLPVFDVNNAKTALDEISDKLVNIQRDSLLDWGEAQICIFDLDPEETVVDWSGEVFSEWDKIFEG